VSDDTLTSVSLSFEFADSAARYSGDKIKAESSAIILPGNERNLEFRLPCPATLRGARVSIPSSPKASEETSAQQNYVLVSHAPNRAHTYTSAQNFGFITTEVPDLSVCPYPEPCELQVHVNGGGNGIIQFRREYNSSELISRHSPLVAHLENKGTATIFLGEGQNTEIILLSDQNLREAEISESFWQWLIGMVGA
jgi:hypothetical protein